MALALTGDSRVFFSRGLAGPFNVPEYKGRARTGALSWDNGALAAVRLQSDRSANQYDLVTAFLGQQDDPSLPILFRYSSSLSELLELIREECPVDLEVHWGKCGRPDDYLNGWLEDGKITMLDRAQPVNYTTDDLGTFDADGQAAPVETLNFTGDDLYEVVALQPAKQAEDLVTSQVSAVLIDKSRSCGLCGTVSGGCGGTVFATLSVPIPIVVIFTQDHGETYQTTIITSSGLDSGATGMAIVGENLVVATFGGHHYARVADILNGTEVWTQVTAGYIEQVSGIFSLGPQMTWTFGHGEAIYFSTNITEPVTLQNSSAVPFAIVASMDGNESILVAGLGPSGGLLVSENEGEVWTRIAGPPQAGPHQNQAIAVLSDEEWFVGTAPAGDLWHTSDRGETWRQVPFEKNTNSPVVVFITHLRFVNRRVGYMSQGGGVFRTWNGGHDWVEEPQNKKFSNPFANTVLVTALDACESDPNLYYAGGNNAVLSKGSPVV